MCIRYALIPKNSILDPERSEEFIDFTEMIFFSFFSPSLFSVNNREVRRSITSIFTNVSTKNGTFYAYVNLYVSFFVSLLIVLSHFTYKEMIAKPSQKQYDYGTPKFHYFKEIIFYFKFSYVIEMNEKIQIIFKQQIGSSEYIEYK